LQLPAALKPSQPGTEGRVTQSNSKPSLSPVGPFDELPVAKADSSVAAKTEAEAASTTVEKAAADLRVGDIVCEHFKLVEHIADQGTTRRFRARDLRHERDLHLVLVTLPEANRAQLLASVRNAVELTSKVDHRGLTKPLSCHEVADGLFTVQLAPSGLPLRTFTNLRLQTGQRFDEDTFLTFAEKLCEAVAALHEVDVHGFLSPDNVIVSARAIVVSELALGAPLAGHLSCDPDHTSPEVLRGEKPRFVSDVFALGRLLQHMGASGALLAGDEELRGGVADIVKRATQALEERRFPSVTTVLEALRALRPRKAAEEGWRRRDTDPGLPSVELPNLDLDLGKKKSKASREADKPKAAKEADKPKAAKEADKPKAAKEADKPKAAKEADKPKAPKEADKPKAPKEADKPKTSKTPEPGSEHVDELFAPLADALLQPPDLDLEDPWGFDLASLAFDPEELFSEPKADVPDDAPKKESGEGRESAGRRTGAPAAEPQAPLETSQSLGNSAPFDDFLAGAALELPPPPPQSPPPAISAAAQTEAKDEARLDKKEPERKSENKPNELKLERKKPVGLELGRKKPAKGKPDKTPAEERDEPKPTAADALPVEKKAKKKKKKAAVKPKTAADAAAEASETPKEKKTAGAGATTEDKPRDDADKPAEKLATSKTRADESATAPTPPEAKTSSGVSASSTPRGDALFGHPVVAKKEAGPSRTALVAGLVILLGLAVVGVLLLQNNQDEATPRLRDENVAAKPATQSDAGEETLSVAAKELDLQEETHGLLAETSLSMGPDTAGTGETLVLAETDVAVDLSPEPDISSVLAETDLSDQGGDTNSESLPDTSLVAANGDDLYDSDIVETASEKRRRLRREKREAERAQRLAAGLAPGPEPIDDGADEPDDPKPTPVDPPKVEETDAVEADTVGPCPSGMKWLESSSGTAFCIDQYEHPGKGKVPRVGISLIGAESICQGSGKRLCSLSEWKTACGSKYPYKGAFDPDKCVTQDKDGKARSLAAAGSQKSCRGGQGTYDMSGNAAEWVSEGVLAGGSFASAGEDAQCSAKKSGSSSAEAGFRCCKTMK